MAVAPKASYWGKCEVMRGTAIEGHCHPKHVWRGGQAGLPLPDCHSLRHLIRALFFGTPSHYSAIDWADKRCPLSPHVSRTFVIPNSKVMAARYQRKTFPYTQFYIVCEIFDDFTRLFSRVCCSYICSWTVHEQCLFVCLFDSLRILFSRSKLSAPIAQSGERWTPELTGSESPVRAASALDACSWLGLPAVGGSGRAQGKVTSVERGGPSYDGSCYLAWQLIRAPLPGVFSRTRPAAMLNSHGAARRVGRVGRRSKALHGR